MTGFSVRSLGIKAYPVRNSKPETAKRVKGAVMAEGIDYDKLQTAVKAVMEQPGEVSEETAETLTVLENTDMFEMLVSGDEGKMNLSKT